MKYQIHYVKTYVNETASHEQAAQWFSNNCKRNTPTLVIDTEDKVCHAYGDRETIIRLLTQLRKKGE